MLNVSLNNCNLFSVIDFSTESHPKFEICLWFTIRNRNLYIFTVPTKAKSREPAYSQTLNQSNIDRQRVKIQRFRQADRRLSWKAYGVNTWREAWGKG